MLRIPRRYGHFVFGVIQSGLTSAIAAGVASMPFFGTFEFIENWVGSTLVYVAPVATAFAYWAVVEAGRRFAAGTVSMTLLATPSLGLLISAWALNEAINGALLTGVVLTAAGIRLTVTR